jgi:hypothetical protein
MGNVIRLSTAKILGTECSVEYHDGTIRGDNDEKLSRMKISITASFDFTEAGRCAISRAVGDDGTVPASKATVEKYTLKQLHVKAIEMCDELSEILEEMKES